jgi:hypothetical protein
MNYLLKLFTVIFAIYLFWAFSPFPLWINIIIMLIISAFLFDRIQPW